jgi:DNA polymerase-4
MVATWVVMAASYEARACGIHSAMHATEARRLCPEVIAVEPRSEAYAEASEALFAVFEAASPVVERHGIEEAFLEGPPSLAARLREEVRREVGLPVTVGVAGTKIAAKMASRAAKPDGLKIVEDERAFLHVHRIEQLWGIGKATAAKLHARGIGTVGEAAALSLPALIALLGTGNGRVDALARPRRPSAGGAGAGRGARRRAIARDRHRRTDDHAAPALRRPHDGDPFAHASGGRRRRDGHRRDGRRAGGYGSRADAHRRQRLELGGGR